MAEQCIVCLDTLLHAAEEPPPPPLPGDTGTPSSDSTITGTALSTAEAAAAAALSDHDGSGPSTIASAAGTNGHGQQRGDKTGNSNDAISNAPDGDASASPPPGTSSDDDHVAVIQVCGHKLHDACLREWSTKANSCPICRQSFNIVDVYDKIGGKLLSTYTVEDKKQVAEFDPQVWLDGYEEEILDDEVSTPCPVCNLADNEEVLLLCDGCDTPYHTHCIGLDSVPEGAWFCMECVDLFGGSVAAPQRLPPSASRARSSGRRSGASRGARNDFFPRTRHTMRRARRRARSDEWQGAWGQITGRIWDALNIDVDHDEDEALEEFRRVERLRDNERREFERWQERLDIARRLGAQDVFERNIPTAILHHATRHGSSSAAQSTAAASSRPLIAAVQQSQEERQAWGDFERARDFDRATATPVVNTRKRKSRSATGSPIEPSQEPERKLKRPRTRRIGAPSDAGPASKPPASVAEPADRAANGTVASASASASSPQPSALGTGAAVASTSHSASPAHTARSPLATGEPPSFLSTLLKEVEMSAPSDDENIRSLFGDPPPLHTIDPTSPVASSPATSAYNSPRAMSSTPPPQKALRPSSPTLLSSHILPVYPPANYSPTRAAMGPILINNAGGHGTGSGSDHSDSEGKASTKANGSHRQQQPPNTVEIRQPRPLRMPSDAVTRSKDASPTRHALSLEMKESISRVVRTALDPHWKSSELTADQYAAINRDVSRKLYEEVTNPNTVDADVRKLWERKASREVERAVAGLQT